MPSPPVPEPTSAIQVAVTDLQRNLPITAEQVQDAVRRALEHQGIRRAEFSVVIVDDAAIRSINARHLGHDWATDVISFPFGQPGDQDFGGELVISAETAVREAAGRHVAPHDEFALYLVHGLLHCCGMSDATEVGVAAMRQSEGVLLAELGINNPFEPERVV